jgi:AdoMet-dependent heme synthase
MTDVTGCQSPPLRLLFWESTARCNLACAHCRRTETAGRDELSTAEVRAVLESAATLGRPIVVLSGGEPLMRDDWEELARCAAGLNLPVALATNGTLIDEAVSRRIAAAGFARVSVSLDGPDAATHDAFRGQAGAFARALDGIAALRRAGVAVQINATVARHNAERLDEMYELAKSLGASALHLFLLVPVGCGVQLAETHQLPPAQYERVLNWLADRQAGGGLELKATCAPHYHRVASRRGLSVRGRGCLCGISVAFVGCRGGVFPCGYLPVSCGSVRQSSLAEIWRTSQVFAKLRDDGLLGGKCGACDYRSVCGGCRARAYAATGDYLAEEPQCAYRAR